MYTGFCGGVGGGGKSSLGTTRVNAATERYVNIILMRDPARYIFESAAKQDCLACGCFRNRRQPKQLCLGVGVTLAESFNAAYGLAKVWQTAAGGLRISESVGFESAAKQDCLACGARLARRNVDTQTMHWPPIQCQVPFD